MLSAALQLKKPKTNTNQKQLKTKHSFYKKVAINQDKILVSLKIKSSGN